MFCSKCGKALSENDSFCSSCGTPVAGPTNEVKTIRMICQECNGFMDIDMDKQVVQCPFCGSSRMIVESDDVKIERIRKESEIQRQQMWREVEIGKLNVILDERNRKEKEEKIATKVAIVIWSIFLFFGIIGIICGACNGTLGQ